MSLNSVFYPKSIAVVGASSRVGSVGNDVLKNILTQGFDGTIYPINPKNNEILGLKCYPSITDLPATADLAVVIVPAAIVPQVFEEIAAKEIKSAIVISAGFKETGPEGKLLEDKVRELCNLNKITLIGVNCLGIMNVQTGLNASFAANLPAKGHIAFVAQSGALCTAVIDYSAKLGLGFSKIISVGNKTDIDELALLEYLDNDPQTKVTMMYIEDVVNAHGLLEKGKSLKKPVVVLKSGRTESGKQATASHTGALGGSDAIYDALFRQSKIIRADNIEDLFNFSLAFATNPIPKGPNVAIITNAGGPGGITSDAVEMNGLKLAKLSEKTEAKLKAALPAAANIHNPIDVLGDSKADRYELAINACLEDENVDSVLVILTPQSMTEIEATAVAITTAKKSFNKPIITSFMGLDKVALANQILAKSEVTTIPYPDLAAKTLGLLWKSVESKNLTSNQADLNNISSTKKEKVNLIIQKALQAGQKNLPQTQVKEILEAYELPVLYSKLVTSAAQAQQEASSLNTNLVLKIESPDIVHKSDVGGVILDVKPNEAGKKYDELIATVLKNVPEANITGVLMMEMVEINSGYELILGVKDEPGVGKSIMFGLGGVLVEVLKDVTFSIAPLNLSEADKMIGRIKSAQILKGVRGKPKMDTDSLVNALVRLSELVTDFPQIKELDINPLLILPDGEGSKVLDSRILLG